METNSDRVFKNRWIILANIIIAVFMSCLDSSIVNVTLPVMARDLVAPMASIEWVVTSYLIIICAVMLLMGRLSDIYGKAKVFQMGLATFTIGSFLCGIASSLPLLVIARVIQAVGAAGTMATNQGLITQIFPPTERGRALGISGAAVALGALVGPSLGGFIVSLLSWHYIFLINLPFGLIAWLWSQRTLPRDRSERPEPFDWKGALLFFLFIVPLFGGLIHGQTVGYGQSWIVAGFILSVVSLAAFLWVERHVQAPLLHLGIFRDRLFSLSIFCGFISFIAISCSNIIQPFYLHNVQQLSPAGTGLIMSIFPLLLVVVAPASGYLSDKIGSELLTFVGLVFTSFGLFLMSRLDQFSPLWVIGLFLAVLSIGNGLFQSPNNSLIMSTVPRDKLGIAGSVNALVRNLGMTLGITYSTSLLYFRMGQVAGRRVIDYIPGRPDVFIKGMSLVYLTAAAICLSGALLTAYRLYRRPNRKARGGSETME